MVTVLSDLVGRVGAAAVGQHGHAGRIVAHRNRKRGAESCAVVAVLIQAHIDHADRVAVVVGHDQLVGVGVVLGIDRAGLGGNVGSSRRCARPAVVESGRRDGRILLVVLVDAAGRRTHATVQRIVLAVDHGNGVAAPVETKSALLVCAHHRINRALAQRGMRAETV